MLAPYFAAADGLVAGANWADLHTYLPDDLMVKVDVASMAHGLETRSPLLDHVLLEWALSIPAEIKMAGGTHQGAVQGGDGALPAARRSSIAGRWGSAVPIDQWLRHELKELAYDTLMSPAGARSAA